MTATRNLPYRAAASALRDAREQAHTDRVAKGFEQLRIQELIQRPAAGARLTRRAGSLGSRGALLAYLYHDASIASPCAFRSSIDDIIHPKCGLGTAEIWMAPTKAAAEKSFHLLIQTYTPNYACRGVSLEGHRRTPGVLRLPQRALGAHTHGDPIESVFATVCLRTDKTKGAGSRVAGLTMVFKLMESVSKKWRGLRGHGLIRDVIAGVAFVDGVKNQNPEKAAA